MSEPEWLTKMRQAGRVCDPFGPKATVTPPIVDTVTEKDFMAAVAAIAKRHGWRTFHPFDSRKSAAGWPDMVFVRERIIYAEFKTAAGKPTADQLSWLDALRDAGADVRLWRPADMIEIVATLTSQPQPQE